MPPEKYNNGGNYAHMQVSKDYCCRCSRGSPSCSYYGDEAY